MSDEQQIFAIVPIEMARDRRLGAEAQQVLLALFAARDGATNLVWPGIPWISQVTGLAQGRVENCLEWLCGLGWLCPLNDGGYEVTVP